MTQVFPDYRERVVAHEAAHFLAGYLLGVPVTGYGLMIGQVCPVLVSYLSVSYEGSKIMNECIV